MIATVAEGDKDVDKFVFAIVRGDMDVNETKLANAVKAKDLRPAREDEIRAVGATPGYASPINLAKVSEPSQGLIVVVDDLIPNSPNLVAGANEDGYHLLNTNYGRDYTADVVTDLATAEEGAPCPDCGNPLRASRGVEVGNIFQLGTRYSDSLGCKFLDKDGQAKPVIMGSYGIGSGRLLACIAEEYHDEYGLKWPITVAPYEAHLTVLSGAEETANQLYAQLQAEGIEVLYDDRDETAGVKFKDADLIGVPLRLTVSTRSLKESGVEFKRRTEKDRTVVPLQETVARVKADIADLKGEIAQRVKLMPYKD